jgi:hypothetical protein
MIPPRGTIRQKIPRIKSWEIGASVKFRDIAKQRFRPDAGSGVRDPGMALLK